MNGKYPYREGDDQAEQGAGFCPSMRDQNPAWQGVFSCIGIRSFLAGDRPSRMREKRVPAGAYLISCPNLFSKDFAR